MPGAQCTRSPVCAGGSEVCTPVFTAEAPETSGIPHAMVLTVYGALSPATNSSCHRRLTDCMASHIPLGLSVPPRDLTPTTGARTTRLRRPQQCRSSRAPLLIAHEFELALRSHAHTTSSRPPHPAPRFVTIGRNAPLHRGGMGRAYKSDLPDGLSEIFFATGLDRNSQTRVICPSGANPLRPSAPHDISQRTKALASSIHFRDAS